MGIKKRTIGIVIAGDIHIGLGRAMAEALTAKEMSQEIIIVGAGSGDTIKEEKEVNNQFGNPPMKITNLRAYDEPPLPELKNMEFSNPWPSPKGRKGKRKW